MSSNDQSQDALPFVVCPETVALIDSRKYYSRDRANERDRLAMRSGVPAARRGDVGGYVEATTKHLEQFNG